MKKKRIYKIILSFVMTGLLFVGLLLFEKSKQPKIVTKTVVTAKRDIPEGICLTEENIDTYLMETRVDQKECHGDQMKDKKALLGKKAKASFRKGSVLQKGWFLDTTAAEEQLESPVTVGVRTEDLSAVLGGSLRRGDFVDLYFVNKDTAKASLVFAGVLVREAYDSTGKTVGREERDRAASMVTLLLEEADTERLCELLAGGSFRMAKTKDRSTPYERLEEEIDVQTEEVP